MFYQVPASELYRAAPLFGSEPHHLAVASALAGASPAQLYVDSPHDPRTGALILWNDRLHLAGAPDDAAFTRELAALLRERYAPRAVEAESAACYHATVYMPPTWEEVIPSLFAGFVADRAEREDYRLDVPPALPTPSLPAGFHLRRVDEALAADASLGHHSELLAEMQSEAPSVADFLAGRFGFCVQHDDELVAWCLSEYNHNDRCEVGIETLPAFQRRGLATATAQALIAHAHAQRIQTIGWHCLKRNLPSSSLALKLGFRKVADYPAWYCRFGQAPTAH